MYVLSRSNTMFLYIADYFPSKQLMKHKLVRNEDNITFKMVKWFYFMRVHNEIGLILSFNVH